MFSLDGKRTRDSVLAQLVLDNSGLPLEGERSFALTLYQKDPVDSYLYLTAMAGIKQKEPMFGLIDSDHLDQYRQPTSFKNPVGFSQREGTFLVEVVDSERWRLYVNGRSPRPSQEERFIRQFTDEFSQVKTKIVDSLNKIFTQPIGSVQPLYPELWLEERLARDMLRAAANIPQPGAGLEEFAKHLTSGLENTYKKWLKKGAMHVGIYLDTGDKWTLCGRNSLPPWLPKDVESHQVDQSCGPESYEALNAFDWVRESTNPLLLDNSPSPQWKEKLKRCGLTDVIINHPFSGMCLVPILHIQQSWRCMGVILLTTEKTEELKPAHLYLLNRLSIAISVYLIPLLPIPGFSWLPDTKLGRGEAEFEWDSEIPKDSENELKGKVEAAVENLMPYKSKVNISTLSPGHSGTGVFRLKVSDSGGIGEIPRVLKIGNSATIQEELRAYYRYVHNKKIGGASRIDIAREFCWGDCQRDRRPRKEQMYGAIVYTFVGAGDQAVPWSLWVKTAEQAEVEQALVMLYDQLSCWHVRKGGAMKTVIELMIGPHAEGKLHRNDRFLKDLINPSLEEIQAEIDQLYTYNYAPSFKDTVACTVHGDLHSENIFAILTLEGVLRDVALIDWGRVQPDRHPLSDISKLMVDLAYKINPSPELDSSEEVQNFYLREVQKWGKNLGCARRDWLVALIHQLTKFLLYSYGEDKNTPYLSPEIRQRAWVDFKKLANMLKASPSTRQLN